MTLYINTLVPQIKQAVKAVFADMERQGNNDRLYAFALYSDEDALTLCAAGNTQEYLKEMVAGDPEDGAYYRFEPAEWGLEADEGGVAANMLDAIGKQLYTASKNRSAKDRLIFREQLAEICIVILNGLRDEGFFAADIFLLYTISDGDISAQEMNRIVARLNDNPYRDAYRRWTTSW